MNHFEFDGEAYKRASRHQKEWGDKLMAGLRLTGREDILDLGCGDGVLTLQLARQAPEGSAVGIDASSGMIETAKKLEGRNLSFRCMDINEMDFDSRFDVIYSNAALHWVKDHERLLRGSLRALKPGGTIRWNFAGEGTCQYFIAAARAVMNQPDYAAFFDGFPWPWFMTDRDSYAALVEKTGFSRFEVTSENADRYFSDSAELIGWIDQPSIVPFLTALPGDKKQAFRDEVVEQMLEKTRQPDGRCFETFRRLNVTAVK